MKRIKLDSTLVVFLTGGLLDVIFFLVLSFLSKDVYFRIFFFRSWYIQAITTWLFFTAVLYILYRFYDLKKESDVLNRKLSVERLDTITPQEAKGIMEVVPEKYREAMSFRRINELLRGYLRGEEVVRLNQELSRRDIEQIEGGHLILNALKQLVPVLGFLGTVIGLSIAMVEFSDLTESAGLEMIRARLKGMGASLSVAFETTVLALGYAVILILVSSFLRKKEESFVAEVDNKARMLISKLSYVADSTGRPTDKVKEILERLNEAMKDWLNKWQRDFSSGLREFFGQLSTQNEKNDKEVIEILSKNGDALLKKLDELKDSLHEPPRYEIIVQPLKGKANES